MWSCASPLRGSPSDKGIAETHGPSGLSDSHMETCRTTCVEMVTVCRTGGQLSKRWGEMYKDGYEGLPSRGGVRGGQAAPTLKRKDGGG